mgnify:CR=1 FL=1
MRYLNLLLICVPLAIVGSFLQWSPLLLFWIAALGVIPLARLMGRATEELAAYVGPRVGGLLNATLGNAAELIIAIFAIREGLLELVKASITGSILGNLLLVMGASLLLGGLRYGRQHFDRSHAGVNATMTILSIIALAVLSLFFFASEETSGPVEALSLGVATAMILVYGLGVLFSLNAWDDSSAGEQVVPHDQRHLFQALGFLLLSTVFIAWLSEILVGAVEHTVAAMRLSEFFLGIIVVPLVGNVAEHLVGIQAALKNQMELSLSISIGSSLQVALFVAPILVFTSLLIRHPLTLVFNRFELIALFGAALIAVLVALDGESNWLEGAQLLIVYVIIGLAFFYLPV